MKDERERGSAAGPEIRAKGAGMDGVGHRSEKGLRMKELTAATGLPKSAILHYVAQGLLPEPTKTSRNMAYYAPECVERIAFIRSLQEKYAFPLGKIKEILSSRDEGKDTARLIELCEVIFEGHEGPVYDKKAFSAATGLDLRQVRALEDAGLLLPLDEGGFNGQDVTIGRYLAKALSMGLRMEELDFYAEAAKRIVEGEMTLRTKLTSRLPDEENASLTAQLVQAARVLRNYVLDRSFQKRVSRFKDLKGEDKV